MNSAKTTGEGAGKESRESGDPVLRMLGVGKHLWHHESGNEFVERLRSEDPPPSPGTKPASRPAEDLQALVWRRILDHQREVFHTATRKPFTFEVEGNGMWFFRDGKRVNRKLTRAQVEVGISRCPLKRTTEIKDLMDYAYLFGVLIDKRIRGQEW